MEVCSVCYKWIVPYLKKKLVIVYDIPNNSWAAVVHTFVPALKKQRLVDLCEFESGLVFRVSSRTVRAMQRNSILREKKKKSKREKEKGKKGRNIVFP